VKDGENRGRKEARWCAGPELYRNIEARTRGQSSPVGIIPSQGLVALSKGASLCTDRAIRSGAGRTKGLMTAILRAY